jgi:hypothetical protein
MSTALIFIHQHVHSPYENDESLAQLYYIKLEQSLSYHFFHTYYHGYPVPIDVSVGAMFALPDVNFAINVLSVLFHGVYFL